ncbi:MAG: hypothetical protein HY794_18270 [Desulfarculus sp.]|nr:hypothetical protein [Desulfarculus sp.]
MDLHNYIKASRGLSPQVQTNADTAFVSQIVDTANFEATEFLLLTGAISDANVTFTVLFEDGDASNLSDAAAVADAYLLGTEALATPLFSDDNKVFKIGYIGGKRYCRVTITPSGNDSGDINIAGVWVQSGARVMPQA